MSRLFTTEKGTVLPLLNLRGRDYLEVKYRLVWFREEHPQWTIETEILNVTDTAALARAVIRDEAGRTIATSHKAETVKGFPDFIEKAETGAVGRALALIGYGTQFCADELDEGTRIVDSPTDRVPTALQAMSSDLSHAPGARDSSAGTKAAASQTPPNEESLVNSDLGEFVVRFGKKYMGKRLKDIPQREIESYVTWLKAESEKRGGTPSFEVRILEKAVQWYHHPETRGPIETPPETTEETRSGEVSSQVASEAEVRPGLRAETQPTATGRRRRSNPA